jgi:antitoxin Phd
MGVVSFGSERDVRHAVPDAFRSGSPGTDHSLHVIECGSQIVLYLPRRVGYLRWQLLAATDPTSVGSPAAAAGFRACCLLGSILYDYSSHHPLEVSTMREIQLRDAKASLSAVVDEAVRGEPTIITRHGKPEAVILSFKEWERLSQVPSFGRLLMSAPISPDDLPERDRTPLCAADL